MKVFAIYTLSVLFALTCSGEGKRAVDNESYDLILASYNGNYNKVKNLVLKGSNVNGRPVKRVGPFWASEVWTPLIALAYSQVKDDKIKIAELLIKNGANLDLENGLRMTALYAAILYSFPGNKELALLLIKHNANINLSKKAYKDSDTKESLFHLLARKSDNTDILRAVIVRKDAKLNVYDNFGRTPLDVAMFHGNNDAVELLKKYGAKNSPRWIAAALKRKEMKEALRDLESKPKALKMKAMERITKIAFHRAEDAEDIIPELVSLVDHPDKDLRTKAQQVLKNITNQDFKEDKEKWNKWWQKKRYKLDD